MSELIIEIRHLVKEFDGIPVVNDVSLTVRRGEFFSILGPSGSGKTTLLRLLAGLEAPLGGDIIIEGHQMVGVSPHLRPVNMVFQSYALFPHMTVLENIGFGLRMKGIETCVLQKSVSDVVGLVRLRGKESRYPAQLSGGEQQRVALARALVNRPAILLLDEPMGALDQQLRQMMQGELKAIQREVGLTFLYVTHHQEEALTMSDRVAVMQHGRILQVGTPAQVYEHPTNRFVAEFMGNSNHLTLRLIALDEKYAVAQPVFASGLTVKIPLREGMSVGSQGEIIIRPERIHLKRAGALYHGENNLPGHIEKVMYGGNEWHVEVRLTQDILWKVRMSNAGDGAVPFAIGEGVQVCWAVEDMRVLQE